MFGGIPDLYPPDASRPVPVVITKNVSRVDKCSVGWAKSPTVENH